jgi:hypothetical protein
MTETKPKRRWLRFSLRTLFIAIAVISAAWVAYQLNWIRERHAFLERFAEYQPPGAGTGSTGDIISPWPLRPFGEQPRNQLFVPKELLPQAHSLFPEAILYPRLDSWK